MTTCVLYTRSENAFFSVLTQSSWYDTLAYAEMRRHTLMKICTSMKVIQTKKAIGGGPKI